jgi:NADH:ubiquinone oxidoreductase subunit C
MSKNQEIMNLSLNEWSAMMSDYHIKVAHDYFMDIYIPVNKKTHAQAVINRLKNINIGFEYILKITGVDWSIEEQDNLNNRMKGVCEVDAYLYTCSEEERLEILNLIKMRIFARKNKIT